MSKKRGGDEGGGDSWLNTYADMVTLLLTFFAVLLSMSNTDEQKFNAFIRSFTNMPQSQVEEILGAFGDATEGDILAVNPGMEQPPEDLGMLFESLKQYVEENNQTDAVEVSKNGDVIYIRFNSALFFEPDRYTLLQSSLPTLDFIGEGLKRHEDQIKMINVIGHTATVQNGNYWMLSGERAATVVSYLNYQKGVDPKKLLVMGYGNQYPVAGNETEDGRKQNRRVEMIIIGKDSEANFNVYDALGDYYDNTNYPTTGDTDDILYPDLEEPNDQTTNSEEGASAPVDAGVSPYEP